MAGYRYQLDIGKIQRKPSPPSSLKFSWVIHKYFSLPQEQDWSFSSHTFDFLDAKWSLVLSRNEFSTDGFSDWIMLSLVKEFSNILIHRISYKMSIEKKDGIEYVSHNAVENFEGNISLTYMPFILRSKLLQNADEIMPNGKLTIHCVLKADDGNSGITDSKASAEVKTITAQEDSKNDCDLVEETVTLPNATGTFKLAQDIQELLLNGLHSDTTIKISNREFQAHRAILSSRSPVFRAMFLHNTSEQTTGTIEIEDCEPDVFLEFLSFLYSGVLDKLSSENALELYALADKYDVQEVKAQCLEFMTNNLSTDNFCDVIVLALRHDESQLLETATDFFVRNAKKIAVTTKWLCFHKEYPVEANELFLKSLDHRDRQ